MKDTENPHDEKHYAQLCGILGKDALEAQIGEKMDAYFGLLTRDTAVFLIAKMHGIAKDAQVSLTDARAWMRRINTQGKIARVFPLQTHEKNGREKKSVRMVIEDAAASRTLVLWDAHANLAFGEIGVGDEIRIVGSYMTRDKELALGADGSIERTRQAEFAAIGQMKEGLHNIKGEVREIYLDYHYMKNGTERKMGSFLLAQGDKEVRVVLWAQPQAVKELAQWDAVRIENALFKNNELQLGEQSRLVKLSKQAKQNVVEGEIASAVLGNGGIIAQIGGREIVFEESAMKAFLGIKSVPEGVSMHTLLELKKESLLGKKISVEIEEKETLCTAKKVLA